MRRSGSSRPPRHDRAVRRTAGPVRRPSASGLRAAAHPGRRGRPRHRARGRHERPAGPPPVLRLAHPGRPGRGRRGHRPGRAVRSHPLVGQRAVRRPAAAGPDRSGTGLGRRPADHGRAHRRRRPRQPGVAGRAARRPGPRGHLGAAGRPRARPAAAPDRPGGRPAGRRGRVRRPRRRDRRRRQHSRAPPRRTQSTSPSRSERRSGDDRAARLRLHAPCAGRRGVHRTRGSRDRHLPGPTPAGPARRRAGARRPDRCRARAGDRPRTDHHGGDRRGARRGAHRAAADVRPHQRRRRPGDAVLRRHRRWHPAHRPRRRERRLAQRVPVRRDHHGVERRSRAGGCAGPDRRRPRARPVAAAVRGVPGRGAREGQRRAGPVLQHPDRGAGRRDDHGRDAHGRAAAGLGA